MAESVRLCSNQF